ncbi:arsenic resistance N-acetyltransferase ArsN2 [Candidatus Bipolaricaulota bacterium]
MGHSGSEAVQYGPARPFQLEAIRQLLDEGGLPHADITASHLDLFLGAMLDGILVGVIGLEIFGRVGLARSLAVSRSQRGHGIASSLLAEVETLARRRGVEKLYGLTETIAEILRRRGYRHIDRNEAPPAIRGTSEFQTLCPSSAVLMAKDLHR